MKCVVVVGGGVGDTIGHGNRAAMSSTGKVSDRRLLSAREDAPDFAARDKPSDRRRFGEADAGDAKGFPSESSSEDEDEAFTRRRTNVKEMKIEPLPHSGALRKWTNDLVSEAARCSNRSKRRTLRYLRFAFGSDCIEPP